jgi:hypothetical protein
LFSSFIKEVGLDIENEFGGLELCSLLEVSSVTLRDAERTLQEIRSEFHPGNEEEKKKKNNRL